MKKLAIIPMAALMLAACDDSPLQPAFDSGPSFIALHAAIPAPANVGSSVAAAVVGSDVTISWTWADPEDSWDLVSFTVKRDGVEVTGDIANAKPYAAGVTLNRSHTDLGVANGTYEYCVEVMAKYFDPQPTVTRHHRTCVTVAVGAVYTIDITGGSAAGGSFNRNANNFNFEYRFLLNGTVITDCSIAPTVATTPTATIQQHNCDPTTGARNIIFNNPTKGTSTSFTATWTYNSVVIHTKSFSS